MYAWKINIWQLFNNAHNLRGLNVLDAGNETIVRLLLDKGASVNAQVRETGWTALMYAALNGHINVVQVVLYCNSVQE